MICTVSDGQRSSSSPNDNPLFFYHNCFFSPMVVIFLNRSMSTSSATRGSVSVFLMIFGIKVFRKFFAYTDLPKPVSTRCFLRGHSSRGAKQTVSSRVFAKKKIKTWTVF